MGAPPRPTMPRRGLKSTPSHRRGRLCDHERALKRLEADASAIVCVADELPNLKREVTARTTEVETKLSMELGEKVSRQVRASRGRARTYLSTIEAATQHTQRGKSVSLPWQPGPVPGGERERAPTAHTQGT